MSTMAPRHDPLNRCVAASVLAHGVIVILLGLAAVRPPDGPSVAGLDVEIVVPAPEPTRRSPATSVGASAAGEGVSQPASQTVTPARAAVQAATPAMVRATTMLSAAMLADPRSRRARQTILALDDGLRIEQLCGVEATAQVDASDKTWAPDLVVAYARAATTLSGDRLVAKGAAIHGKGGWRELQFECGLSPDHTKVVSLSFAVGQPIAKDRWEALNLGTEDGPVD